MQGTGTKTDPFIPETWDDFVTAVGTEEAYVSLPAGGGTYDMNEIAPEGNLTIDIRCAEIQGNEWSIIRAYNFRVYAGDCKIYNLHFLDFLLENSGEYGMIVDGYFYYCKFSGIISGYEQCVFGTRFEKRYCSFNFKYIGESYSINYYAGKMYFCNITINHADSQIPILLSVSVHGDNLLVNHVSNGHNGIFLDGKLCVLCSDLGNVIANSSGRRIDVTDEQLRDVSYLCSIGFPIV